MKNPQLFHDYREIFNDYLEQEIIELVPKFDDEEIVKFYLPHREVIKLDRATNKLRIVFDALSHEKNCLSVNNYLHPESNLYSEFFNLLMRFRFNFFAFIIDMKHAYLQIFVHEEDKGCFPIFIL